jgi:hypothetical protein
MTERLFSAFTLIDDPAAILFHPIWGARGRGRVRKIGS